MADLNIVYSGVLEYFDPKADSGIPNPSTQNWFGGGGSNFWLSEMPWWAELDKINKDSASTLSAVKVAFVTGQDRAQFITDRILAINNRVSFIKTRTLDLLATIAASGSSTYDVLMKGFTAALSAVPVVGSVVSYVVGKDSARQAVEQYKVQRLVQDYTTDLEQLALIRAQFIKELATLDPDAGKVFEAPTAWPIWYYFVAAGVLVLFLMWLKKRRKK